MQKWKRDPNLHSCKTEFNKGQINKKLNYDKIYVEEFLNKDPLKDWESIERCIKLFEFCFYDILNCKKEYLKNFSLLDCGTKDAQFPEYCNEELNMSSIGVEISDSYFKWATEKNRPVVQYDICNLPKEYENLFDIAFSHHVFGLTSSWNKALKEMFRVIKPGGFLITLNSIPGNKKKHYSYIESSDIIKSWLNETELNFHDILYFDYIPYDTDGSEEFLVFLKKK